MGRVAFTVAEVAGMLGVSDSQVRRLLDNGTLRKVDNLGGCVRIGRTSLVEAFGADAVHALEGELAVAS